MIETLFISRLTNSKTFTLWPRALTSGSLHWYNSSPNWVTTLQRDGSLALCTALEQCNLLYLKNRLYEGNNISSLINFKGHSQLAHGKWAKKARRMFTLRQNLRVSVALETSINSERLQNRPIFSLLLTQSGRWSLKKGYSVQNSFLLLHPKTIHESGILSKKKAFSLCFYLFRTWMALVIMRAGNIFATLRNKWPTKAILYRNKIRMEEFSMLARSL